MAFQLFKKRGKVKEHNISSDNITILYGSRTGNAEFIAKQTRKFFQRKGVSVHLASLKDYKAEDLQNEKRVLFVISTYGMGEPAPSAMMFYNGLKFNNNVDLSHLDYAICALGDSSYDFFCNGGKKLEEALLSKGAKENLKRKDCDVDFQHDAARWIGAAYKVFFGEQNFNVNEENEIVKEFLTDNPVFEMDLIYRERLTDKKSGKEVFHLVLHSENKIPEYKPGDSIEILPRNEPELVMQLIDKLVAKSADKPTLQEEFEEKYELGILNRSILEKYAEITKSETLKKLTGNKDLLNKYVFESDFLSLVNDYPAEISVDDVKSILPTIKPRLYSIASSQSRYPNEIHLTVKTLRRKKSNRSFSGVCSTYINNNFILNDKLQLRLRPSNQFSLPENEYANIILVATGTGIAPFRAFLQERKAKEHRGKTWLFFGEQHEDKEFLYKEELLKYKEEGILNRLTLSFSRDQNEKLYVQHKLEENSAEVFNWLYDGGYVYVCGSTAMGQSVKKCLIEIAQKETGIDEKEAEAYVEILRDDSRYCEDVY